MTTTLAPSKLVTGSVGPPQCCLTPHQRPRKKQEEHKRSTRGTQEQHKRPHPNFLASRWLANGFGVACQSQFPPKRLVWPAPQLNRHGLPFAFSLTAAAVGISRAIESASSEAAATAVVKEAAVAPFLEQGNLQLRLMCLSRLSYPNTY
jgi:hypothetical protein